MFVSFDDGGSWEQFQLNLPRTPITDIKVHQNDLVLSTMGRAFWIMDNITPLRQGGEAIEFGLAAGGPNFLEPLDAYRIRGGGGGGGSPDQPRYSRRGAELDYMLDDDVNSVRIEIMDEAGSVLRSFEGPGSGTPAPTLHRGLNRFVWDLTVPGPNGAARGGPTVVPGTYMARLTVDGRQQTRSFEVLMDPRVAADGVTVTDLQEQFDLGIQIRDAIEDADATIERLEGAMRRVSEGSDVEAQLKEIADAPGHRSVYLKLSTTDATGPVKLPERELTAGGPEAGRRHVRTPRGSGCRTRSSQGPVAATDPVGDLGGIP